MAHTLPDIQPVPLSPSHRSSSEVRSSSNAEEVIAETVAKTSSGILGGDSMEKGVSDANDQIPNTYRVS